MDSPDSIVETSSRNKRENKNKRRFTDEQVKLLESMFESETKLEPRRKAQVARELGLQPRQIAIWFQNKRARWQAKHIEKEFAILHSDYEDLKCRYERLKNDKQSLLVELQRLRDLIQQPEARDMDKGIEVLAGNKSDEGLKKEDKNCGHEPNPCRFLDDDVGHRVDGSSGSPERWRKVDERGIFHQPCCDSTQWWDFWN